MIAMIVMTAILTSNCSNAMKYTTGHGFIDRNMHCLSKQEHKGKMLDLNDKSDKRRHERLLAALKEKKNNFHTKIISNVLAAKRMETLICSLSSVNLKTTKYPEFTEQPICLYVCLKLMYSTDWWPWPYKSKTQKEI